jgi:hypothetical protein
MQSVFTHWAYSGWIYFVLILLQSVSYSQLSWYSVTGNTETVPLGILGLIFPFYPPVYLHVTCNHFMDVEHCTMRWCTPTFPPATHLPTHLCMHACTHTHTSTSCHFIVCMIVYCFSTSLVSTACTCLEPLISAVCACGLMYDYYTIDFTCIYCGEVNTSPLSTVTPFFAQLTAVQEMMPPIMLYIARTVLQWLTTICPHTYLL